MEQRDEKLENILDLIESYRVLKKYPAEALNSEPVDARDQLLRTLSQTLKTLRPEEASSRRSMALCLSLLRTIEEIPFEGTLSRIQKKPGASTVFTFSEGCLPHPFHCHLAEFADMPLIPVPAGPFPYSTFTNVTSALYITKNQHLHTVLRGIHRYLSERVNEEIYHHTFDLDDQGFIDQPEILSAAAEGLKPYPVGAVQETSSYMDFYRGGCSLQDFDWTNKKRGMMKTIAGQASPVISLAGRDLKTFLICMDAFVKQLNNTTEEDRTFLKNYLLHNAGQETTHIAPASIRELYSIHPAESGYSHVCWGLTKDKEHFESEVIYNAVSVIHIDDGQVYMLDPKDEESVPFDDTRINLKTPLLTIKLRVRLHLENNTVVQKITHYEVTSHAKDLPANPEYISKAGPQNKI